MTEAADQLPPPRTRLDPVYLGDELTTIIALLNGAISIEDESDAVGSKMRLTSLARDRAWKLYATLDL